MRKAMQRILAFSYISLRCVALCETMLCRGVLRWVVRRIAAQRCAVLHAIICVRLFCLAVFFVVVVASAIRLSPATRAIHIQDAEVIQIH